MMIASKNAQNRSESKYQENSMLRSILQNKLKIDGVLKEILRLEDTSNGWIGNIKARCYRYTSFTTKFFFPSNHPV
jgi:hypothetical protein